MVHYFYGYLQVAEEIGEDISIAVPSGGFGNLCGGGLARKMGLPIKYLIAANNKNACLNRIFSQGIFSMAPIHQTVSSAIDILNPMNFWRYLYFCIDKNTDKIKAWNKQLTQTGAVHFDESTLEAYSEGFLSGSVSDEESLSMIKTIFETDKYLIDPHTAVALALTHKLKKQINQDKLIVLSTAHPAKFPHVMKKALGVKSLPQAATHHSIEKAKWQCQKSFTAEQIHLEAALLDIMTHQWEQNEEV